MNNKNLEHVRLDNIQFIYTAFSKNRNLENVFNGEMGALDIWLNDTWHSDGRYLLEGSLFNHNEFEALNKLNEVFSHIWLYAKKTKKIKQCDWNLIERYAEKFLSLPSIKKDIKKSLNL